MIYAVCKWDGIVKSLVPLSASTGILVFFDLLFYVIVDAGLLASSLLCQGYCGLINEKILRSIFLNILST